MKEIVDNRFLFRLENGILYFTWLQEYVDEKFIDDAIKARLSIIDGKPYPMLSNIENLRGGTKKARERLAQIDGEKNLTALAVLYKSNVQHILVTLFSIFYKPRIPVKYFRNQKKAIEWIEQFKLKNDDIQ